MNEVKPELATTMATTSTWDALHQSAPLPHPVHSAPMPHPMHTMPHDVPQPAMGMPSMAVHMPMKMPESPAVVPMSAVGFLAVFFAGLFFSIFNV